MTAARNFLTEDEVRDAAKITLGLGKDVDETSNRAESGAGSGVGQTTTFGNLGFDGYGKTFKPDGWYLPYNVATPALILETKSTEYDIDSFPVEKLEDEVLKYLRVVGTRYRYSVAVFTNGHSTRAFIYDSSKDDPQPVERAVPSALQSKHYYLKLFSEAKIDKEHIYTLTRRINDLLHFEFGIKNLNHRMIFTACALVAYRNGESLPTDYGYEVFQTSIKNSLNSIDAAPGQKDKLTVLSEVFSDIKMNLNTDTTSIKDKEKNKRNFAQFAQSVQEISEAINSDNWRGEDVMGIFFNEFNRYRAKSELGQVFTPDHITDFMYHAIKVTKNDAVLDACCGSGAFLTKSMSNMIDEAGGASTDEARTIRDNNLYGIELDREVFALACANMLIHKDGKSHLAMMNTLSDEAAQWIKDKPITKVLMNPPYERKYKCMDIVENVMDNVGRGTQCAFLLPDKKLEKSASHMKRILKKHKLEKVVKLPENLFFGVGVTVSLFIFEAGKPQIGKNAKPDEAEFFAWYMDDDGLETVKNSGRHDVRGKWDEIMSQWLKIISHKVDHESKQLLNVNECMSWQEPQQPFSITREDFMKVAVDYKAFQEGLDVKSLREKIADKALYGGVNAAVLDEFVSEDADSATVIELDEV